MGYLTPKTVRELSTIMERVHNENSTAHLTFKPDEEPIKETWFDRWVLRWV